MATKIITKNSSTASAAPVAADLSAGELAINTNDGKLFYKDSGGTVRTLASKDAAAGTFATLSASGNVTLSGGTANGVLYLNGSKVATSGSALTFDGTNFATTGTASATKLIPTGGTATGNGLYLPAANTLGFSTNGTQGMTLDSNSVLSVLNAVESTGAVQVNSANKITMSLESASTGRIAVFGADTSTFGTLVFSRAKSNGGTTESARIDSSGNLGIGTTTMTRNFNIGGSNAAVGMNINNTGTSGRSYSIFSTNSSASAVGALGFYDDTAGSYRMVIDSSGNLLVGATGATSNSRLSVKGSSTSASDLNFFFVNSAGSTVLAAYNNGALYADNMKSGAGTNTVKFSTSTGQITYDTSSARYKDNIRDSIYGLNHVMQMRSAQFEYKDDGRSDVGLIAEELDPIIPELVGKNKEGQPDSVSYDRMVSVLVKAIQELKTEFDAYKATHP